VCRSETVAYLHVVADALTSLLAIVALLAGEYFGAQWLIPDDLDVVRAMVQVHHCGDH